mmetsp:Transcript_697/g.1107  ORF Transcript_697/g.1107 Transcript_697/m.1107 type:complete len:113 (-) Transcript_697:132-470(-)
MKANEEQMEKRQAPKDTKLMVRIPAGRSAFLLSHPMSPPKSADMTIRLPNPHSSGVRYKSALALVRLQIRWSYTGFSKSRFRDSVWSLQMSRKKGWRMERTDTIDTYRRAMT